MSAAENLKVAQKMQEHIKKIKSYNDQYNKVVVTNRKKIADNKKLVKDGKNYKHDNYNAQVEKNESHSLLFSIVVALVITAIAAVAVFIMLKNYSGVIEEGFKALITDAKSLANPTGTAKFTKAANAFMAEFNKFMIIGIVGVVLVGIWSWVIFSEHKDDLEWLSVITFLGIIVLKIVNIVIAVKAVIALNKPSTDFMNQVLVDKTARTVLKTLIYAGIGLGINIVLAFILSLFDEERCSNILDKLTLNGARLKDERAFARNKKTLFADLEKQNIESQQAIDGVFATYKFDVVKKDINDLEKISPIYCDFYQIKKIDGKDEVVIDTKSFNNYTEKVEECIKMIKSGRASDIKEALKEISADENAQRQQAAINLQTANILDQLHEEVYGSDDYDGDYYY